MSVDPAGGDIHWRPSGDAAAKFIWRRRTGGNGARRASRYWQRAVTVSRWTALLALRDCLPDDLDGNASQNDAAQIHDARESRNDPYALPPYRILTAGEQING